MDANLAVRAEPGPAAGGAAAQPALVSPEPPPQNRLQRPLQLEGCRCVGALAIATATTFLVHPPARTGLAHDEDFRPGHLAVDNGLHISNAVRGALWRCPRLLAAADEEPVEKSRLMKPKFGQDTSSD